MRALQASPSEPKRRLLEAATRLFAEHGFDRVSVRDITKACKANIAAVNYHFGSREDLLATVLIQHAAPVLEVRLARFEILEKRAGGKSPVLEEVIEAFIRPVFAHVRKSELPESLSAKLLGRIFATEAELLPESLRRQIYDSIDCFMRLLAKSQPSIQTDELAWRVHFVNGAMIHALMLPEWLPRAVAAATGAGAGDLLLGRLIRYAASGLREELPVVEEKPKGPQAIFDF
jgi:AcrR family transcriptional regulator